MSNKALVPPAIRANTYPNVFEKGRFHSGNNFRAPTNGMNMKTQGTNVAPITEALEAHLDAMNMAF